MKGIAVYKVLLVDDEPAIIELLKTVLEMDTFEVTAAGSAREASGMLSTTPFDLVVTDIRMETPTAGFDVVAAARAVHPLPVIVLLTAFPVPASQWKGAGADALLIKGQDTMLLSSKLENLLASRTASQSRLPRRA